MVSNANMQKMLSKDSQLSLTQCYGLTIQPANSELRVRSVEEEIETISKIVSVKISWVLEKYKEILQEPVGLPPIKKNGHQIVLK